MSSLNPEDDQKWVPTHVQVTVLKGRGLRGKGKNGTSDVYTIIQLGKEKYSTCVAEKTTEPEWREECTFELQPGALESGSELVLIVMHRALIGLDVFLGQAVIPLDKVFTANRGVKNEWYRLNSKTGKKEKERGDIQVTVQFTRNNLTASMYDLVMKDKGVSTFFKLKERIKGKRHSNEEDSSSAILPGGYGSLVRMRQRLPSDGGGEEYYEDDEGGEVRRSKMRTFFLRGKLRKSSDTRSSTSLGSESSESSSRGGSLSPTAGISVVVSDLSNSPSNSSNLTADNSPEHTANTSPKLSSPKCEFGDEAGEITIAVPQPKVCVNGSHSLSVQPLDSGKAAAPHGLGLLKPLPLSMSLQNLSPRDRDLPPDILGDGRRWSFDKPDAEEKAAIAAALEQSGPMQGDPEEDSLSSVADTQKQSKDQSEPALTEDRHRGWFGSKDSHNKPSHSGVVSPTDPDSPHSPPLSRGNSIDSFGPLFNLFSPSQPSPPPLSHSNPFFTTLHNPFYKDMSCTQPLNASPPPLPFLSSARPPIATLFPEVNMQSSTEGRSTDFPKKAETENSEEIKLNQKMPNPFSSEPGLDSELDHSFDEFAAGRLQSPDHLTSDPKTQSNTPSSDPPFHCINKDTMPLKSDAEQTTNDCLCFQPMHIFTTLDTKDTHHFFTKLLDTIPENSMEHDCKPGGEAQQTSQVNADISNDSNGEISDQKFNSSSPDPSSSGIGSSAEEDGLSCFSSCSASDKLSSSEEAEVHNLESSFEKKTEEDFTDKSEDMSLDQQTVIEDYTKEAIANSSKLESTPSVTNTGIEIEKCHTNPDPEPDIESSERERSPTLPPVFVTTSSPGLSDSLSCAIENTNVVERDQLSPIPVALFTDFPNTSSISLSRDTSLSHTDASDRTSFAHSLYVSADSQEYQTCLTHATSGHLEKSANSTLCLTQNSIQMANHTATDLDNFFNTRNDNDMQPARQDGGLFGDFNGATFETNFTNFTAMDNFSLQSPKEMVFENDMFTKDIDGIFVVKQISIQEVSNTATDTEDLFNNKHSNDKTIKQGGFDSDFNTFETNFTQLGNNFKNPNQEVPVDAIFSNCHNGLFGDVKGEKFESSFTAVDDFILQSDPVSPQQDFIVEDVFSNNPNGGYFDDWVGAKIESDYTDGTFSLQSSKEEVLDDISRDLFDSDVIFESNLTAADDFILQSHKQQANDLYSKHQDQAFDNIFETNFTPVDISSLQSDHHSKQESLKAEAPTLQRSQSVGFLVPAFDELQLSAFGSDPELTSSKPQPDLLLFSPFTPSLIPQCSSSPLALCPPPPVADAASRGLPTQQQQQAANQLVSPHPVKPLTTATAGEEKRTESRSMLEKLKFTRNAGKSSQCSDDSDKKKSLTEGAGSYYHLTHSELVALLVQREAELQSQKVEFERQKILLAKRETELKKLKPQVRDLEDYIDTLLVRIMEQKPTLLQVRSKFK
ncbi:rab11 family-interacting protein 1 [Periophthalmus magnuspinnatus]|uniref:rab11 family-interacting protein 1 n=1 Tax=Periophthalmus magnuspinnatus TaxID=409849 RepID=UPI00145AD151|nr:rab11 family-interacting protein 1 [Periophthalmus magnuspinnatus]